MTPTIHPAGPHARVITLTHPADRFTVPAPPLTADTAYRITTITVSCDGSTMNVSLQGETVPGREFIDLADLYTPAQVTEVIYNHAPTATQQALGRSFTELRHPAGKAVERDDDLTASLLRTTPGQVTDLRNYRRTGRR